MTFAIALVALVALALSIVNIVYSGRMEVRIANGVAAQTSQALNGWASAAEQRIESRLAEIPTPTQAPKTRRR